jgi:hypothetical protein
MAHIAHQPGPVCLEGGVSRWLVGVVDLGAELLQRPQAARDWGASLIRMRVPKKYARCTVCLGLPREVWPGWLGLLARCPMSPDGGGK